MQGIAACKRWLPRTASRLAVLSFTSVLLTRVLLTRVSFTSVSFTSVLFTSVLFTSVLLTSFVSANAASGQTASDMAELAQHLATQIKSKLAAKFGGQPQQTRVAIFPFGNSHGKITREFYAPNKHLQGELIIALRQADLPKGTFVLDQAGLAREFQGAGIDPSQINPDKPATTSQALQKIGVAAAVVGKFDAASPWEAIEQDHIEIIASMMYQDGTVDRGVGGQVSPIDDHDQFNFPSSSLEDAGRFAVELLAKNPQTGQYQKLPLITSREPGPGQVLFCVVPEWIPVGTPQARFRIRLANAGTPIAGKITNQDRALEKRRLYAVVLTIDGVNSIYQDQGNGTFGPVTRHPKNCAYWILSGPGDKLIAAPNAPSGYRLQRVPGLGHSVVDIPGFQRDNRYAQAFLFAETQESIAQSVGITHDIGVIEAHFYPQQLPGDQKVTVKGVPSRLSGIGTKAGKPVENPIFQVRPKLYRSSAASVRIFYGREPDCPIPKRHRVPLQIVNRE